MSSDIKEYLDKEATLHRRDGEGKLLPLDAKIVGTGSKTIPEQWIKMVPMSRGELQELRSKIDPKTQTSDTETDFALIKKHIIEPKYTDEEIKALKDIWVTVLVNTVYINSGVLLNEKIVQSIDNTEDEVKKK